MLSSQTVFLAVLGTALASGSVAVATAIAESLLEADCQQSAPKLKVGNAPPCQSIRLRPFRPESRHQALGIRSTILTEEAIPVFSRRQLHGDSDAEQAIRNNRCANIANRGARRSQNPYGTW